MTAIRSTASLCTKCRGQAMIETAIGLVVFVFVVVALTSFANLFLGDLEMISMARSATGADALAASGGSAHGIAFNITRRAHPKFENYGDATRSSAFSDPYAYPCETVADDNLRQWRTDAVTPLLSVPPTSQVRNFPIDISLMGSDPFFPRGITLDEKVYMPPLGRGGLR